MILAGADLLAVDLIAARLMDFRTPAIRHLDHLSRQEGLTLEQIEVVAEDFEVEALRDPTRRLLGFRPPHRWPSLSARGLAPGDDEAA